MSNYCNRVKKSVLPALIFLSLSGCSPSDTDGSSVKNEITNETRPTFPKISPKYEIETNLFKKLPNKKYGANGLAFSKNGKYLARVGSDEVVTLFDRSDYSIIPTLKRIELKMFDPSSWGGSFKSRAVSFSPNGEFLATGNDYVGIVKTSDGQAVTVLGDKNPYDNIPDKINLGTLAYSPDGKYLVGNNDNVIMVWETTDWRLVRTLEGHTGYIDQLTFSPDGNFLVSTSGAISSDAENDLTRVWDTEQWNVIKTLKNIDKYNFKFSSASFSTDMKYLAAGNRIGEIYIWNVSDWSLINIISSGSREKITEVLFAPDGNYLVSSSRDDTIAFWDIESWERINTITEQSDLEIWQGGLDISSDSKYLASIREDAVYIYNVSGRTLD